MLRFQIPPLISFGLGKYYYLIVVDFHWPKLFEDYISVIFDKFSYIKCLSITKNLLNAKLLADGKLFVMSKHSVDTNLFTVGQHLVDNKQLASMKMLTVLTYLPDLTIYIRLVWLIRGPSPVHFAVKKHSNRNSIIYLYLIW